MLEQAGYLIVTEFPSYTVTLKPGTHPWIVVDVPDAQFGRLLTHRIGDIAPWNGVFVRTKDGNQNDKAALIEIPDNDAAALKAVCVGTMRALDQIQKIATQPATVANAPFLNASELLANASELIIAEVHKASTTTMTYLSQVVTESQTATHEHLAELSKAQTASTTATYSQIQHCVMEASRQRQALFADLMAYYARPRWWHALAFWRK